MTSITITITIIMDSQCISIHSHHPHLQGKRSFGLLLCHRLFLRRRRQQRETPAALFETSTSANVKDVKLPWKCVDGVVMTSEHSKISPPTPKKSDSNTLPSWMMSHGVTKKLDETNLSSEEDDEDDEDDLSEDVDFAVGNTLKWLRSEEKEKDERNKRRAEEQAEEDKKRRATEGYRPAFIIDVDGIPLEVVEIERRLAADADAAAERLSRWKH